MTGYDPTLKVVAVSADGIVTNKRSVLRAVIVLTAGTSITVHFKNDTSGASTGALPSTTAGTEYLGFNGIVCDGIYANIDTGTYSIVYSELDEG